MLATELFKESRDLALTIFCEIFSRRSVQYNLRHASESSVPKVKSTFHGIYFFSFLEPKNLGFKSKGTQGSLSGLSAFKNAIKTWKLPLKITLVDYIKNALKILVSSETFSNILDFFL